VNSVIERDHPRTASIDVVPSGGYLGAEIGNVDLRAPTAAQVAQISDALVRHEVIVFRDQDLSFDELIEFGRRFGKLSVNPFTFNRPDRPEGMLLDSSPEKPPALSDRWHSDESFRPEPPLGTILRGRVVPPNGGDTVFSSMTTAYKGLSDRMQRYLHGLEALHDFKAFRNFFDQSPQAVKRLRDFEDQFPASSHPVVRVHPVSGKRAIFVNPQFTLRIKDVSDEENTAILNLLYGLTSIPEYQFRVKWKPNTVVFWDNRSTQHYAPYDYYPHHRLMERVTVSGDQPINVTGEWERQVDAQESPWLKMRAHNAKKIQAPKNLY
jgi:Probable taurine catabolism dioxygenase